MLFEDFLGHKGRECRYKGEIQDTVFSPALNQTIRSGVIYIVYLLQVLIPAECTIREMFWLSQIHANSDNSFNWFDLRCE